ncbi:MAG: hypothetical protein ACO4CS_20275, partial [bacterium]
MSNFLEPLANSTLVWSVASGYALDSDTGNYVPVATGITYYASLRQKRNPQYDYLLGADQTAVYMEGRLTAPLTLSGVTPGDSAQATINGREGRFELLPNEEIAIHYWQFLGTP